MTFDHSQEKLYKCLGISDKRAEQMNQDITGMIKAYVTSGRGLSNSKLIEIVHTVTESEEEFAFGVFSVGMSTAYTVIRQDGMKEFEKVLNPKKLEL